MNSSRLFNVSGIPLLMKCGGGCHLLQKLIMLEIHFPTSFVALTGDLGPQIRGTHFDPEAYLGTISLRWWWLKQWQDQGVPGSQEPGVEWRSVLFQGSGSHRRPPLCCYRHYLQILSSILVLQSHQGSMNSIILFKKTPFLFQIWILLLAETEAWWYMSYVT